MGGQANPKYSPIEVAQWMEDLRDGGEHGAGRGAAQDSDAADRRRFGGSKRMW